MDLHLLMNEVTLARSERVIDALMPEVSKFKSLIFPMREPVKRDMNKIGDEQRLVQRSQKEFQKNTLPSLLKTSEGEPGSFTPPTRMHPN